MMHRCHQRLLHSCASYSESLQCRNHNMSSILRWRYRLNYILVVNDVLILRQIGKSWFTKTWWTWKKECFQITVAIVCIISSKKKTSFLLQFDGITNELLLLMTSSVACIVNLLSRNPSTSNSSKICINLNACNASSNSLLTYHQFPLILSRYQF